MDKNAIKKYAVWARRELIDRVTKRAAVYGITEKDMGDPNADSVNGHLLTAAEKRQRQALIRRIQEKGYQQVMEEVAYTWFNRFAALRFMEVNGYLPTHIRVFTDDEGRFKPQILAEAIHLELDGLSMEKVYQLKDANQEEELFKYLLIVQCNALNSILPGMFQKIEDYTELLLPDYLLREGSVIEQMITLIPEDDWKDQVQIIGWLYQYYNTEPKDKVFADLKKNIKISKQNIPAATQLFTPDWIVHYMVENSLGRLWVDGHPSAREKYLPAHNEDGSVRVEEGKWNYYLEEAEQEPEVQAQLTEIRKQHAALKPEEIVTIDPCAGSGHILCVLFDVLVNIYEDYGYTAREAAVSIVENNLWGLDIDDRAAQLAYFAVMMKARQYDRRFFSKGVQPHVYAIQESNGINREHLNYLGRGLSDIERNNAVNQMNALLDEFTDAKEYGSILQPRDYDWALLSRFVEDTTPMQQMTFGETGLDATQVKLRTILDQGKALAQKYHIAVTNPPYMSSAGMGDKLSKLTKKLFPDSKSDLFSVFIERLHEMLLEYGYQAMITQHSWMFLSSFEGLRSKLGNINTVNMVHLGARAFEEIGGEVVQTTAFVMRNLYTKGFIGLYARLIDPTTQKGKEISFLHGDNRYTVKQDDFSKIPGIPIAYWVSKKTIDGFVKHKHLREFADPRQGLATGNDEEFLRLWYEVSFSKIALGFSNVQELWLNKKKYAPFNKGGSYRRWYGNNFYIINFDKAAYERLSQQGNKLPSKQYYFHEGITWSALTSGLFSGRYCAKGFVFAGKGPMCFSYQEGKTLYLCALMNSLPFAHFYSVLSATMDFNQGPMRDLPYIEDQVETVSTLSKKCVALARSDWDDFEISWDFKCHPLVVPAIERHYIRLADCWSEWKTICEDRFKKLKETEEEINRIFIKTYELQDELSPTVDDNDVTVRHANLERDIRSLISFAVGCMFGRYSLDKPGLCFAGGNWQEWLEQQDSTSYPPDRDGILPITDDEYFCDDIVTMFIDWIKTVYGASLLEENLSFIANALGGKGSSREVIREYFLNDFYKDHLRIYQKRPIYWLFDSGRKNGLKALIYMHRYQPDTIARLRTDYVHEMQSRYRTALADVEQRVKTASTSERVRLTKQLSILQAQADELRQYEERVHHLADQMIKLDLDDGVKVNIQKLSDILTKM